ncbi:MAG: glycerol-3-phosphate acyltransferase [Dehalogenimonas sp.]
MEILALVLGYLWGSIPTAYLIARAVAGSGNALGEGNIGGLNTLRRIGLKAGLAVAGIDIAKGAAAVMTAYYILGVEPAFVLGAGVMAVVGHNWMVWLKFRGGKGMAAAVGVVTAASFIYGFPAVIAAMMAVILGVWLVVRNLVLGNGVSLLLLPFITWYFTDSGTAAWLAAVLSGVIAVKYYPVAREDYRRRGLAALGRDDLKPKK